MSSLRICTLRERNGCCYPQYVFIRLGCAGGLTDHLSRGGIYAKVDVDTGLIGDGIKWNGQSFEVVTKHPFSGVDFKGVLVPHWEEAKEIVVSAANAIPGIHFIGWDVVISNDGPFVLEGNVGHTMLIQQRLLGGFIENGIAQAWSEELEAELPDGSLGWRARHWARGRRLSLWEDCLNRALQPLIERVFKKTKQ